MSNKNKNIINIAQVGNFTKNAVKTFEKNIVNETDYLEEIKKNIDKLQ